VFDLVTSDDILAKYRKPVVHKSTDSLAAAVDGVAKNKDKADDEIPSYDSNNLEICQAFLDAKKKLRLILSSVDLQVTLLPGLTSLKTVCIDCGS